ncbi:MAG: polyketide cyclase / dehydrase and lipid transport [Actinomycetia bacterium]|nr:polyketide cyclase / dehydrase and lipid transport [Actinomycetes bacterium]
MPAVDLIDETFVVAAPAEVAAVVHDPARWKQWWPDLALTVFMDRGELGIRWSATGPLVGSVELWLEPFGDGVIVHHFLRADPVRPGADPVRLRRRHALAWKRSVNALKDELEGGRAAGEPRVSPGPVKDGDGPADAP